MRSASGYAYYDATPLIFIPEYLTEGVTPLGFYLLNGYKHVQSSYNPQ